MGDFQIFSRATSSVGVGLSLGHEQFGVASESVFKVRIGWKMCEISLEVRA